MRFEAGGQAITVNIPDLPALEAEITRRWQTGQGFALATLNLDHLAKLPGSAPFRQAYDAQDLVTADGNPIVWMARLAGRPVTLLPGSDLILPLARLAVGQGVTLGMVGSTPDSLARAAAALSAAVPGLRVVAQIAPPMGFDPDGAAADAVLDHLQAAGVRLCFLALGAPKQEILAARGRRRAPRIGFASIGAGLDFLSGTQRRAPAWVRRIAMEWVWRMLRNPRRLALRYGRAALILPGHVMRSLSLRGKG